MRTYNYQIFLLLSIIFSGFGFSQPKEEDNTTTTEIEDFFYKAIEQRAVENYDKAIEYIEKCIELAPENDVFYYELGKNKTDLKRYFEAEQAFLKATELNANERWYWNGLYEVYYQNKDYKKAIEVAKKITVFAPNFKENLVLLYIFTNQKEKALQQINEIEKEGVLSSKVSFYKKQLLKTTINTNHKETDLLQAIKQEPKKEENYINLMLFYSKSNQENKAIEIAEKLAKEIPKSEWSYISLFKFYLNKNEDEKAIEALFKVLENETINIKIKHKLFNELLIFSANSPIKINVLEKAIAILSTDKTINVNKEVAKFYFTKNNYTKTIFFLEKILAENPNDWESIVLLLETLSLTNDYEVLANRAIIFIDSFPTQPQLYFYAGYANYKQNNNKEAIRYLEEGIDFLIENKPLEIQFNELLATLYTAEKNTKKSAYYKAQVQKIKNKK